MAITKYVQQVRRRQTQYKVDHAERLTDIILEAKGLDIPEISKVRGGVLRATLISKAIEDKTPVDTSKGKRTLTWINDSNKQAYESGDFINALSANRKYIPVFFTDRGEKLKITDIKKSKMFGGGRGSGGGAENTDLTECAQCIYLAALYMKQDIKDLDFSSLPNNFEIDVPLKKIEDELTDDWKESSIVIAEKLKKYLGSGNWKFHKGSPMVNQINDVFRKLNAQEKPKPFSNVNKWCPADIWAVKGSAWEFDLAQYARLGEFNNQLKELHDAKKVVGISLKKAKGTAKLSRYNVKGFVKRPVRFKSYTLYSRDFFKSKDMYIFIGDLKMQFRSFEDTKSWQGEIKGTSAAGGKIGGGPLQAILEGVTRVKFKYDERTIQQLSKKPNPTFMQEFYELYLSLEKKKPIDERTFMATLKKQRPDFIYSKYKSMYYVANMTKSKTYANKMADNLAGYALSASDLSGPFVKAE